MEKFEFKNLQIMFLKTQKTREQLVKRLERQLLQAEKEAENAADPAVKAEWTRIIGFITQTLNGLLKAYDTVRLNEDVQRAQQLIEQIKEKYEKLQRWQQELEARERALKIKEEELNRKIAALEGRG
jgi:chromosome segregation ATPase